MGLNESNTYFSFIHVFINAMHITCVNVFAVEIISNVFIQLKGTKRGKINLVVMRIMFSVKTPKKLQRNYIKCLILLCVWSPSPPLSPSSHAHCTGKSPLSWQLGSDLSFFELAGKRDFLSWLVLLMYSNPYKEK